MLFTLETRFFDISGMGDEEITANHFSVDFFCI